jgi:DNA-binding beta-propeller fold protein YncE
MRSLIAAAALTALLVGCGSGSVSPSTRSTTQARTNKPVTPASERSSKAPAPTPPSPQAAITAETENRLALVDLGAGPSPKVVRKVALPQDPEFVAASARRVIVSSPRAGAVTLLKASTLRRVKVLRGFGAPHIAELSADDRYAYVTDDARGQLDVVSLRASRVVARVAVGAEAHHMAVSPDGRQLWIALSESAQTIVIVDVSDPKRPNVVGHFEPGFAVHDLRFTPNGRRVWMTAADGVRVSVFDAVTHDLAFTVPGGAGPQHVAFAGHRAYIASGYGSQLETVSVSSGKVMKRVSVPYGSFNLDARGSFVVTSSLSRGVASVYDHRLHLERTLRIAPEARDVAILPPAQ